MTSRKTVKAVKEKTVAGTSQALETKTATGANTAGMDVERMERLVQRHVRSRGRARGRL